MVGRDGSGCNWLGLEAGHQFVATAEFLIIFVDGLGSIERTALKCWSSTSLAGQSSLLEILVQKSQRFTENLIDIRKPKLVLTCMYLLLFRQDTKRGSFINCGFWTLPRHFFSTVQYFMDLFHTVM